MHENAREEFTSIRIAADGSWYAKDKKIINPDVLNYFRKNLYRDEKGVYIYNEFRNLKEKGYISVEGPVDFVKDYDGKFFYLSSGMKIAVEEAILARMGEQVYLFIPSLKAWAFFTQKIFLSLIDYLEEKNGELYFFGKKVAFYENMKWVL